MTAEETGQAPARLALRCRERGRRADGAFLSDEHRGTVRDDFEIGHRDPDPADQGNDCRLFVETATRKTEVRRVGRKLVERGIDGEPQSAGGALVDVNFGPRMVV